MSSCERRAVAAAVLIIVLGGCMVGPNYRRPPVETPAAFRFEPLDAKATANTRWWEQFGDPVLDDLIREALANNKSVQIAAANIEQALGIVRQARAPLFPQVTYTAEGIRQRLSNATATGPLPPTIGNPQNAFQLFGGASWELDLWGRIRRLTESARATALASVEARRGVVLSLVASVGTNYVQLRSLDAQLEVARQSLTSYGEALRLFELQFQHGQVSQLNVAQARSQYETAAAAIPPIEEQIVATENALSVLLGRNPGPIARGRSVLDLTLPAVPAGLPSELLTRRPDILQAEQTLVAANAQIGAARALYFPTISLTGTLGVESANLSKLFTGPAKVWSYAGSITGPIFTAGAVAGQVHQAEAGQKAALLAYESAIQNAFADVENALVTRAKAPEQLAAQERLVTALRQYAYFARLQYDAGYAPYLTVLNAQQQLFPAELTLAQLRAAVLQAAISVYRALGGGWVMEAEALTKAQ